MASFTPLSSTCPLCPEHGHGVLKGLTFFLRCRVAAQSSLDEVALLCCAMRLLRGTALNGRHKINELLSGFFFLSLGWTSSYLAWFEGLTLCSSTSLTFTDFPSVTSVHTFCSFMYFVYAVNCPPMMSWSHRLVNGS